MLRRILTFFRPRTRILIRVLPSRPPEETARIFAEWQRNDARLGVTLQLIQEHLDNAQGAVAAHRHDPARLSADAGACEALEALLADICGRVAKVDK